MILPDTHIQYMRVFMCESICAYVFMLSVCVCVCVPMSALKLCVLLGIYMSVCLTLCGHICISLDDAAVNFSSVT